MLDTKGAGETQITHSLSTHSTGPLQHGMSAILLIKFDDSTSKRTFQKDLLFSQNFVLKIKVILKKIDISTNKLPWC